MRIAVESIWASLVLCALSLATPAALADIDPEYLLTELSLTESISVRIEQGWHSVLTVHHHGDIITRLEGYRFIPTNESEDWQSPTSRPITLRDLNADGTPEWAVLEWSGGAHCCRTLHIFSCGEVPALLDSLHLEDSPFTGLKDLDADGRYEVEAADWTFAYWNAPFALSPAPRIVLTLTPRGFELNPALMHRPPPTPQTWAAWLDALAQSDEWDTANALPPPLLWSLMLDLIYQGHPHLAEDLLVQAWPPDFNGRDTFARDFHQTLLQSRWFQQLRQSTEESNNPR